MKDKNIFCDEEIEAIKNFFIVRCETISVAESVTSGLIQTSMSIAQDARKFYQGGISVYNLGQKCRHLSIDPIFAQNCDSVSKRVASDMARNVCKLFTSDWGIGITGYATKTPESDNKLFAYWALSYRGEIIIDRKIDGQKYAKETSLNTQLFYTKTLLQNFFEALKNGELDV